MERASFSDHLKVKPEEGVEKVFYDHDLRCDLTVWLEKVNTSKLGWQIYVKGNDHLVSTLKKEVLTHTIKYLQQRLDKELVSISYEDIVMLSEARLIKSVRKK